jgi:hypothetical protein
MRRLLLICVLVGLVVPAVAQGGPRAADDGTLVVRKAFADSFAQPVVDLKLDGAVVGHINNGRLIVLAASRGPDPVVVGADRTIDRDDGSTIYMGKDISFKATGGLYRLRLTGFGLDLNAVGQGRVTLQGVSGRYALNGGDWLPIPLLSSSFAIGT